MKPLRFVGSSLDDLRNFPEEARKQAGFELFAVQQGLEPSDWKAMNSVGAGVREIRAGTGRVAGDIPSETRRRGVRASRLSKENPKDQ